MTRKAIRIRKLLYNCTIIMLLFGILSTEVMIQTGYTQNRNREIINQAKMIQPFYDSDVTMQSGIQAFFGNGGEWNIVNDKIHVSVERGFVSALPAALEFDMPLSCSQFDNKKDDKLWIVENVILDGENQTEEETYSLFSFMIMNASY